MLGHLLADAKTFDLEFMYIVERLVAILHANPADGNNGAAGAGGSTGLCRQEPAMNADLLSPRSTAARL